MSRDLIEDLALSMWIEREMQFPERVRRLKPDAWDKKFGAWDEMVNQAKYLKSMRQQHD